MKWGTTSALFLPLTSVSACPRLVLTTQSRGIREKGSHSVPAKFTFVSVVLGTVSSTCCKSALVLMIYVFLAISDPT